MAIQSPPRTVTVRSAGPANSTEQLKIRLREATANMAVNEDMEATDKQRKSRDPTQLSRRAAREGTAGSGSSASRLLVSSSSHGTPRVSPQSRSTPSANVLVRKPTRPVSPRPPDRGRLQVRNEAHPGDRRGTIHQAVQAGDKKG
ncbi:hypothetical protein CERZMDRAFT_96167 [Cercospora zeae-maydis SCOH1-5]|uniref:Uncharacterized protein n=1 Tax=Cercospora zeae-maydis SCOH1-5 TaxID=717836 RepID=A0A6A6FL90_9PEZI|nr:hypothetical protein CERZMDRAFT_96167 [Cercospora zeae-maydis SCOH1-5]